MTHTEAPTPTLADFLRARLGEDSARVLAECEAKCRIVAEHAVTPTHGDPCDAHNASYETIPCDTLLLLAAPYADHPDYRPEWRR